MAEYGDREYRSIHLDADSPLPDAVAPAPVGSRPFLVVCISDMHDNPIAGARVRIEKSSDMSVIDEAVVGESGVYSTCDYDHSDGMTVNIRVRCPGYNHWHVNGVSVPDGCTFEVVMVEDPPYSDPDGAVSMIRTMSVRVIDAAGNFVEGVRVTLRRTTDGSLFYEDITDASGILSTTDYAHVIGTEVDVVAYCPGYNVWHEPALLLRNGSEFLVIMERSGEVTNNINRDPEPGPGPITELPPSQPVQPTLPSQPEPDSVIQAVATLRDFTSDTRYRHDDYIAHMRRFMLQHVIPMDIYVIDGGFMHRLPTGSGLYLCRERQFVTISRVWEHIPNNREWGSIHFVTDRPRDGDLEGTAFAVAVDGVEHCWMTDHRGRGDDGGQLIVPAIRLNNLIGSMQEEAIRLAGEQQRTREGTQRARVQEHLRDVLDDDTQADLAEAANSRF